MNYVWEVKSATISFRSIDFSAYFLLISMKNSLICQPWTRRRHSRWSRRPKTRRDRYTNVYCRRHYRRTVIRIATNRVAMDRAHATFLSAVLSCQFLAASSREYRHIRWAGFYHSHKWSRIPCWASVLSRFLKIEVTMRFYCDSYTVTLYSGWGNPIVAHLTKNCPMLPTKIWYTAYFS